MISNIVHQKLRNQAPESARTPTPEEQRRQAALLDHKALRLRVEANTLDCRADELQQQSKWLRQDATFREIYGEEIEIAKEFEKDYLHNQNKGDQ
jgi:hypothetical protein